MTERVLAAVAALPAIRRRVKKDLALPGLPREKVMAFLSHYGLFASGPFKVERFVDLARTFHLPIVYLVDCPGFLIGPDNDVILWGFTAGIIARLFGSAGLD